jgi:superfamily II DNA or RNA helicase
MNLYSHQQKIITEDPKKAGLFLGTGSGKTRIALSLARGSTLVICPKTQKEDGNWERECCSLLFGTYHPSIVKDLPEDFTVISKETFRRDHATLPAYDTVIVDEAHTCLGLTPNTRFRKRQEIPKASQLFEALDEYLKRTKPERIYLCTATIMKSPMTVLAAKWILTGESSITTFYQFRQEFYTRLPMPGREVWAPRSDSESKDKLAAMVRSLGHVGRLEDFFDVPDQTFKTVYVELTPKQKGRIAHLAMEYPEPIVRIGKRHQIENGCLSGDEFNRPELFSNAKIERIKEYALEFPQMVIFARYRAQIDMLEAELAHDGYKVLTLTGDTKDRGAVLAEANASAECIFIAQCQVSAGWELPEYPVMIFASRDYSFVNYDQAIGRIQRANNIKKNLYISLVVKGGVDEAVDRALINKQDFNERIFCDKINI